MNFYFSYFFPQIINILIVSLLFIKSFSSCIIILPFEIFSPYSKLLSSEFDLMSYLNNLSLYSNISIGSPPQQIQLFIRLDKSGFIISNNSYIHNNSLTYKEIGENSIIDDEIKYNCTISSDSLKLINIDTINLNKIIKSSEFNRIIYDQKYQKIFNNISFINKITDEIGYNDYGYIGLKFQDKNKLEIINFVTSLKDKNITNNYVWTLLFDSKKRESTNSIDNFKKIKGKFILGDELYNYYSNKFNINNSYQVNIIQRNGVLNWDLEFSNIYINTLKLYISTQVEIRPDSVLNFGSLSFKFNIDTQFFSPLFKESICQIKNMTLYPDIMYYICDSSILGNNNLYFDIKKFPSIIFEHKRLGGNFTLTYNDLFLQDDTNKNIFYFLFVFDRTKIFNLKTDRIVLGTKFLEKYQFEFDIDKKIIRYYHKNEFLNENENDEIYSENKNNYKIIIIICLSILLGILLFFLGMIFQRTILKIPRKMRANELNEDYEYMSKKEGDDDNFRFTFNE